MPSFLIIILFFNEHGIYMQVILYLKKWTGTTSAPSNTLDATL